jgi:hypothetical protein
MLLRFVAVAASVTAVLATAPAAAAATAGASVEYWGPGNCPQGMLCIWPNTDHPPQGPTATPSLMTDSNWSGNVTAFNYYNYTSRNVDITWSYFYDGRTFTGTDCARPGESFYYVPLSVTKVKWRTGAC